MIQNQRFSIRSWAVLVLGLVLFSGLAVETKAQVDGAELYNNNCVACHKIDQDLVGPALKGITERRDEAWLLKWIRNSQAVIASGDQYAVDLFAKWNKIAMPAYDWSDEEIKAVLAYVKEQGDATAVAAGGTAAGDPLAAAEALVADDNVFPMSTLLYIIIFLAAAVIFLLVRMQKQFQNSYENKVEKGQLDPEKLIEVKPRIKIKPAYLVVGGLGLFLLGGIGWGIDVAQHIGIQQGYQPSQPIAFSHELHAGKHEIQCSYCHTGVERGKSATLPSVNVCMNCHNQILTDKPEIKKIAAAWENNQPIEWVRIHNLQDFAYFNHYQHYKIAGIECQTCHGPIQEMPEVYQHSQLTMGWCINCHRETNVNLDNGYYQQVHGDSEKFKNALTEKGLTIANLGGLECSKCHY